MVNELREPGGVIVIYGRHAAHISISAITNGWSLAVTLSLSLG